MPRKGTRTQRVETPTVERPPRFARGLYRWSFVKEKKSKADARDELNKKFAGRARVTEIVEHPVFSGWFFTVTLEIKDQRVTGKDEQPYPLVSLDDLSDMTEQAYVQWCEKWFSRVREHFQCPRCWKLSRGKPQSKTMQNYHSKGAIKVFSRLKCDACGMEWQARVKVEHQVMGIYPYEEESQGKTADSAM